MTSFVLSSGLSYDELLAEARKEAEGFRKKASEYVPKMYEALRKEGVDPHDAKDRIEKDLVGTWTKDTIRRLLPEEYKNPEAKDLGGKGNSVKSKLKRESFPHRYTNPTESEKQTVNGEQEPRQVIQVTNASQETTDDYQRQEEESGATTQWLACAKQQASRELEEEKETALQDDNVGNELANPAALAARITELEQEDQALRERIQDLEGQHEIETVLELDEHFLSFKALVRLVPKPSCILIPNPPAHIRKELESS